MENTGILNSVVYNRIEKGYRLEQIYQLKLTNAEVLAICKILLDSRAFFREEMTDILEKLISCCVPKKNQKLVTDFNQNLFLPKIQTGLYKSVLINPCLIRL